MWDKLKDMCVEDPFQFWLGVSIILATIIGIGLYA